MPERVVDRLEMIDVDHDQAARLLGLLVGLDEQRLHAIEFRAIGHLGERILVTSACRRLAAFFERSFRLGIVQQHRGALQATVGTEDGNRVQIDWHEIALPTENQQPLANLRIRPQRPSHGARAVANAAIAVVAHVEQARGKRPPVAAPRLMPVICSAPLFHRVILACVSTNTTPSCIVSINFCSKSERPRGARSSHCLVAAGRLGLHRQTCQGKDVLSMHNLIEPPSRNAARQHVLLLREHFLKLLDQIGIKLRAGKFKQFLQRPISRPGLAIDLIGGHRIERVDDGDHPCFERNRFADLDIFRAVAVIADMRHNAPLRARVPSHSIRRE